MKVVEKWGIVGKGGELFNGVLEPTEWQALGAAGEYFVHWDDLKEGGAKAQKIIVITEQED